MAGLLGAVHPLVNNKALDSAVIGFDGQRMLLHMDRNTVCVDTATGREIWTIPDQYVAPKWFGNGVYSTELSTLTRLF